MYVVKVIEIQDAKEIKSDAWMNFSTAFDFDSPDRNFKYDFAVMTKKYGQAYIEYCRAAWAANDGVLDEEEFRRMNGNIPEGFFNGKIKGR